MKVHITRDMNKLPLAKRAQISSMLCEGSSMRTISRVADGSINSVAKLLADAGEACAAFRDGRVRGVRDRRVQCDEIRSFCYAKQRNVADAKAALDEAGDIWTWTALDTDTKLIVSFLIGGLSSGRVLEATSVGAIAPADVASNFPLSSVPRRPCADSRRR